MTVAAVIFAAAAESDLRDAAGATRVRRIADAAWSGGALPVVVVAADPDGSLAAALAGAPVTLAAPALMADGPGAQIARGIDVATTEISETSAALIWPARLCWVGPETVTSLVEAHGRASEVILRPRWRAEAGWPVLVPVALLPALWTLGAELMPEDLVAGLVAASGLELRTIDLGDPGTVIDGATPRDELPPYEGPAESLGSTDWGAAAASTSDDAPLAGPGVATD